MYIQTSTNTQLDDNIGLKIAIEEAKKSLTENGVPVCAASHIKQTIERKLTSETCWRSVNFLDGGGVGSFS